MVRAALSCARDAADLVCANLAPESCAKPFRQISACASGRKPEEAGPATAAMPPGFALYENAQERVQAPMPTGAAANGEANVVATAKSADGAVSTVTFEDKGDKTVLTLHELYPSKQALDDAIESGSTGTSGAGEQFELLDELLVTLVK